MKPTVQFLFLKRGKDQDICKPISSKVEVEGSEAKVILGGHREFVASQRGMRPYHLKKQEHEKNHIRILQEKGEQRVWDTCYKRIVKGHKHGTGIDSIYT